MLLASIPTLGWAQAAMTPTTLSSAVTSTTAQTIVVASATGFVKGYTLVVDGEAMTVADTYVSGTSIPVVRGRQSTQATAHAASAAVYVGPPSYFSSVDPTGPCTRANEVALPRIVIGGLATRPQTVSVYDCMGASTTTASWQLIRKNGYLAQGYTLGAPSGAAVTYTALGAITPQPGIVFINGTTLAMTIVDPTTAQNGMTMCVLATNASAHTLTYTAGFNGGTTARDVATFGGAVGDNICFFANSGTWWVISTRNVTLG
jgi:hypothetical protein